MRFSRGIFVRALSLVLSFALTLSTIQVAPAYASPTQLPPARRELVDKRAQFSKTYDNRDGTFTYESYLEPIHFANNETGLFDEIDSSLEETVTSEGRGYKNRRNGFAVFLPETIAEQAVSISDDLGSIRLRPKGRLGEPPVHEAYEETSVPTPMMGNSRSYEHAFGGADLMYDSVAQGLKETIVLRSDTGKNTFSFDLDCPGFTPSLEASGSIAFTSNATGEVRFTMVPPFMEDSSTNVAGDHAYSDAVHYELRSLGVNWRLDVVADDAWLSDPARVYPVRIDPTTFWSQSIYNYDSFVTSAYPTTNYGLSTELKVGRYNYGGVNAGLNRTYIKPAIGNFWDNGYTILSAKLRLYCYHLFYPATTPTLKVGRVESDWSETGITYNNQPAMTADISSAPVSEGAWAEWDVTGTTRQFALGEHPNYGFRIYAANETVENTYWSKFRSFQYAGEPSAPVLKVVFTLEPKVEIVAPSPEVPVASEATTIHAHWRYDDRLGNKQSKARVQVASSVPNYTLTFDSLDIDTTATVMDIPAPAGGWTQNRYWIRMRVWCEANGLDAASNWTDWQPFDRKALLSSSDGQGYSPIRASDAVGAGLAVDLPSGRLIGARSDFAGTGLGGSLGYTLRYDSAGTADSQGYGRGWTLGTPTVSPSAQILPNAGFESANSSNNPIDWLMNNDLVTAVVTSTTPHGGSKYLMMGQNPANGYFSAYVRNNSGGYNGTPVYPGQRLSLSAWVKTYLLTPDTTQAEYGALMKIHFYDAAGALLGGSATTPGFRPTSTTTWWRLGLEAVAPAKAAYATVHLEAKNIKGYTYWDDVSLLTHGFQFTDADGTGRTFAQVGDGVYTRDPLEPGIRFTRVNALKGADGASTKLGEVWEGTDAVLGGDKYNYDETNWKADGTSTLTYELDKAELLSEIDLHLWDYAESSGVTPRQYTYRVQTSEGATGPWATAVDTTTGASWMKHTFTPRRVRFVRIVAIGNSLVGNDGFHVCEIEAPVLKLGDGAVAYTTTGAITATADPSGNPVFVTRDASQRLTGVSDNTGRASNTATRGVDLVRNTSGQLEYLNWRGMSSSGVSTYSVGVVDVARVGSDLRFIRSNGTSDTTVLTYTYDGIGRISGTRDADGIGFNIAYDASSRVSTVTEVGDSTPTVSVYTYQTNKVTVTTSAGGLAAPTRVITYDPAIGYQATSVKVQDASGQGPLTSVAYDEYGQVWKTTDALGRVARTERDGRGNALVTVEQAADGSVLRTTSASYVNDHVESSVDATGNVQTVRYDAAWRPVNSTVAVTDSLAEGGAVSQGAYDEWGNTARAAGDGSTAYSILENGCFDSSPLVAGNGWDGDKSTDGLVWTTTTQPYLGGRTLRLWKPASLSYAFATSDLTTVTVGQVYTLSAWARGKGSIRVLEYKANGTYARTVPYLSVSDAAGDLARMAVGYRPSTDTAKVRVQCFTNDTGGASFDNVRLELANSAQPFSFIENGSFERLTTGELPEAWTLRATSFDASQTLSSDEAVSGAYSALIRHDTADGDDGYFCSGFAAVAPGERYRAGVSIKTAGSVGGAKVLMRYYTAADSSTQLTAETSITPTLVRGTHDWTRYSAEATIPASARYVRVWLYQMPGGGKSYFDAVALEPAGGTGTFAYDAASHTFQTTAVSSTGVSSASVSDGRGRLVSASVTPSGGSAIQVTARQYDGLDRLTRVESLPGSNLGITADFSSTSSGKLSSVKAPGNRTTVLTYDAGGRLSGTTSPTGIRTAIVYDALGRTSQVMAPAQDATPSVVAQSQTYDSLSRVRTLTYNDSAGTPYATVTTDYDIASRVTTTTLAGAITGSVGMTYDTLGRVFERRATGPAGSTKTNVTYDVTDLPLKVTLQTPEATDVTDYTYAKTGELAKITSGGRAWKIAFGQGGALSSISETMALSSRTYDVNDRLSAVTNGIPSGSAYPGMFSHLLTTTLGYDTRDRIDSMDSTGLVDYADTFGYDDLDRLTSWTRAGSSATYAFDAAGNITTATVAGASTRFAYDAENRLTGSTGSIVATYTNDLYGRRTSRVTPSGVTTYTWDPTGHLTQVVSQDATITYAYGMSGMRELKTIERPGVPTASTKSVYTGDLLAAEYDSDGTRYTYLWGPDRTPLSVTRTRPGQPAETFAYHTDALGSVVALTDEDGSIAAATYEYDPYGRPLMTWTQDPIGERNPLRYRAYYSDAETGMFYLPARYYDPATYRFLSPDPAPPSAGDPLSLNAFVYCLGDPVGASDPSGAVSDMEAEAWSHYYTQDATTKGDRAAAHAGSRMIRYWRRLRLAQPGRPRVLVFWGRNRMAEDDRFGFFLIQADADAARYWRGGYAPTVHRGFTTEEWVTVMARESGVAALAYHGHGGPSALHVGDADLDIARLPTDTLSPNGTAILYSCKAAGGVAMELANHLSVPVQGCRFGVSYTSDYYPRVGGFGRSEFVSDPLGTAGRLLGLESDPWVVAMPYAGVGW